MKLLDYQWGWRTRRSLWACWEGACGREEATKKVEPRFADVIGPKQGISGFVEMWGRRDGGFAMAVPGVDASAFVLDGREKVEKTWT